MKPDGLFKLFYSLRGKLKHLVRAVNFECCILGAGPAGLAVGHELSKNGIKDIAVVDKNVIVGGLARTEVFDGNRYDVGPHRFFTSNIEINKLWKETLGDDFIPVERMTRIFYKNMLFNYPLNLLNVFSNLGLSESLKSIASFAESKIKHKNDPVTFEDWIVNKFGRKLYETFFKTYTEKVWGIPCDQIEAEWAAQRIKGLDLVELLKKTLLGNKSQEIKTLVEQFDYPVLGAGQMYNVMAERVNEKGATFYLNYSVKKINIRESVILSIIIEERNTGELIEVFSKQFFSSIPITHFFKMMDPIPNSDTLIAANSLYFREHITVDILIDRKDLFPDQWIYVHSHDLKMARLANYKNFSKQMVKSDEKTTLSVEYFVFKSDDIWRMSDNSLKELAGDELSQMKLVNKKQIENSWIVRETESYPTYFIGYKEHYKVLKKEINKISNVYPIGRGGMYKYNNQDHSAFSGLLAARNYINRKTSQYDLWSINIDAEYNEGSERIKN